MFELVADVRKTSGFLILFAVMFISINHNAVHASTEEQKFWTGLEGEFEKPQVDTTASGMAVFKVTQESIWYLINITGIDKVTAAHIHGGALEENGPILASLFGSNDNVTGSINGTLTQGNITGDTLEVQSAASDQLSEIVAGMKNGSTYVDVHTINYPGGELRGQIMSANSTHAELMMG
ncbi:MAG: CHRD domain-containing protein [Nitrososphaeraceae archaeon]